jgi:hyaluronate lyase
MRISRRAVLSAAPAAAMWSVAPPGAAPAGAAGAGVGAAAGDPARLLGNVVAVFAGTAETNARPEVAEKLAAIEATAGTRLAALDAAGEGELFRGVALGTSDANLTASFQYLYEIALATRVPGATPSDLRDDAAVQRRVIDGLQWLHDHYYGDQAAGYYGNWFNWEIGISAHVSRTLVLLRERLAEHRPDLTATYVASMDAYLRNGENGDVDLDSRFHTGANLADITTNRMLQGAVLGDDARIAKAIADQRTILATIDPYHLRHGVTDGFYADGSFVQHSSVAYTGSYGTSLLTRVVQTVRILDGTGYVQDGDLAGTARRWVVDSFAPLVFEGWMMEIVRGRSVSRTSTNGYASVAAVVEAVTDLSDHVTGADGTALRGYVKHVRETARVAPDPARFVSPESVARYADILADASVPAADLNPAARNVAFNAMDRTVHRRPGYAFAVARSSARISKYEYMSGENLMPWFQGDGAHFLYLAGEDQTRSFGVDYFTAVSPYRLAGVTAPVEERRTIPDLYGQLWYDNPEAGFTSSSESQNTYVYFPTGTQAFSGGATLGAYGAAGLVQSDDAAYAARHEGLLPDDFVVYRNAEATKSWFMFDDEIVVLAAGVRGAAGRAATSTLDVRIADPSDAVSVTGELRDGTAWSGTGLGVPPGPLGPGGAPLAWLRYANETTGAAVGYAFLDRQSPHVALDEVTRGHRLVRTSNPDTTVTKRVFSVSVEQRAAAGAGAFAYALVPGASAARLRRSGGPLRVLANDPSAQAVEHTDLGLVALNGFTRGTHRAGRLRLDGPGSVILRETDDGALSIAVADPTTERDTVSVVVRGRPLRAESADPGVRVSRVPGGTLVEATTHQTYGRSLTATMR